MIMIHHTIIVPGPEGGEIETEAEAGQVGEGAGEVVKPFGLGEDRGDGDEALEGVGEADGGEEGGEEGGGEGGGLEEGGEDCHFFFKFKREWKV